MQKPNGKNNSVKRVNTRRNKDKEKIKEPEHKNPEDNGEKDLKETKMTREKDPINFVPPDQCLTRGTRVIEWTPYANWNQI